MFEIDSNPEFLSQACFTNFSAIIGLPNLKVLVVIFVLLLFLFTMLLKERLNKIYSKHTGKSVEEISQALERDNFMTADEAKKFGLIDTVVEKRK